MFNKYKTIIFKNNFIVGALFIIIILHCSWPSRFAVRFSYIESDEIPSSLVPETTRNVSLQRMEECEYEDIIRENVFMYKDIYRQQVLNAQEIQNGGEYYPEECRPKYSSAIIIPYRQREQQLHEFLIYMHNYLRKQRIHYRIFLVEQYDRKPFNRATLFNIGSVIAAKYEFPCLILHDVDLMPMHLGQIYACSQEPRHMCPCVDQFRFNLPYNGLFGGVVSIQTKQFRAINGMSNMFHGWGGEDDDFYSRLKASRISICRFPPEYSEYTMLRHKKEPPNADRLVFLRNGPLRFHTDGLNSLVYKEKEVALHSLFTHYLVET